MITINGERLLHNIMELGQIGENEVHGIDRWFGSETDLQAREWICNYWKTHLKGELVVDPVANLWLKSPGKKSALPIVIGSHHDAVPCGGKYDGAMGVLMATEIKERLEEECLELRHPLEVLGFTGEEPNPFNLSTLGSKVLCGRLTKEDLRASSNRDNGMALGEAIHRAGGDIEKAEQARIKEDSIAAFIECHIEQGHRMEDKNLAVAEVTAITGIYREEITLLGMANHAGTTLMKDRHDALLAAAELALTLEKEAAAYENGEIVGTVGNLRLQPNEANIIPEKVILITDIRTCDLKYLDQVLGKFTEAAERISQARQVKITRKIILDQPPIAMADTVRHAIAEGMKKVGVPSASLTSMAGHDAANMARICPTGMIFVRSVAGKSHCKEEYTRPEDIVKAANVMLQAVLWLDENLD